MSDIPDQCNSLLWLRAENKRFERRTPLTPSVAEALIKEGYEIFVEASEQRVYALEAYEDVGCVPASAGSWKNAPDQAIILGLKELDPSTGPFRHRHVHFAHAFKQQKGWRFMLSQFKTGGGTLYDLEFLVDESGRRCAAFGYWAGFVGAALAILGYIAQRRGVEMEALEAWPDKTALVRCVRQSLSHLDGSPNALVIGALGRCGQGAAELLAACGLTSTHWDQEDTLGGGPFELIRQHDVLINCVLITEALPPFTHLEHLAQSDRRLRVIADVSCDPYGPFNPLPIYEQCTSMSEPVCRVLQATGNNPPLDIVAIDHLPSLLPLESSDDFSNQLRPYLLAIKDIHAGVWQRAHKTYMKQLELLSEI